LGCEIGQGGAWGVGFVLGLDWICFLGLGGGIGFGWVCFGFVFLGWARGFIVVTPWEQGVGSKVVRLGLGFLGLGLFCAKELWFFDVFAPDLCVAAGNWADVGESSGAGGEGERRETMDVGRGGWGWIGFVLGLFFGVGWGSLVL